MARIYKRGKNYWVDFRDSNDIRRRKKVGPSKRVANEVLDGLLGNVARHQHLGVIEDSAISFASFAEEWWKRIAHTLAPRTQERRHSIVDNHLVPALRGSLRSITAADAEAYVARRVEEGRAPGTVNSEIMVLKHMMRRAVEWEYRGRNPFLDGQGRPLRGVKALKEPPGRVRFLSPEV
jgi:hypothetical protein